MSTVFARPDGLRKDPKNKVDFEAMWVMAARAGYALAFEELVNRNADRIYRLALNITQNQKDAEHLLQETFINAHERLHEFRCGSPLVTWLIRICIQKALQNCGERSQRSRSRRAYGISKRLYVERSDRLGRLPRTTLHENPAESNPLGSNWQAQLRAPDRVSAARRREVLDRGYRGFARTLRFGNKVASTPSTLRCS